MSLLVTTSPKDCSKKGFHLNKLNKKILCSLSSLLISILSVVFLIWLVLHPTKPEFYLRDTAVYELSLASLASSTPPSKPPSSPRTPTPMSASTTTGYVLTRPTKDSRSPVTPSSRRFTRATRTSTSCLPPCLGSPCRLLPRLVTTSAATRPPGGCILSSSSTGSSDGRWGVGCRGVTESM
ncbi:unnamed protein product [Musa textilis]